MFIVIDDLRIHYKVRGSGIPLVALHGWGRGVEDFTQLQQELATKFTVYTIDLPGFGLSTAPNKVWGSEEYASLIQRFLQLLKIESPILLGHSFGGKVLLYLVGKYGVKSCKIVLIGSAGIRLAKSPQVRFKIYLAKLLKFFIKLPFINMFFSTKIKLYCQKIGSRDYQMAQGIMKNILVKVLQENVVTLLNKINVPALLLWGENDYETPLAAGRIMHQGIVHSRFKVIPHSGHFLFLDNWEQVKQELLAFLDE